MEVNELFLNDKEHKFYKKYKSYLEERYDVKINLPDVQKYSSFGDIIFGTVNGTKRSLESVKIFIAKKINRPMKCSENAESNDDITVITLSDNEEECASGFGSEHDSVYVIDESYSKTSLESAKEAGSELQDSICIVDRFTLSPKITLLNDIADPMRLSPSTSFENSICIIENAVDAKRSPESKDVAEPIVSSALLEDSICILEKSGHSEKTLVSIENNQNKNSNSKRMKRCRKNGCQKDLKRLKLYDESKISVNTLPYKKSLPAPDFIALHKESASNYKRMIASFTRSIPEIVLSRENSDVVVLDEPEIIKPSEEVVKKVLPRRLRPIVIDGSNIAREHGKVTSTFSSKGIKICIDFFIERGHTEVTAFVPNYRRHGEHKRFFPTTDSAILEELAKSGRVAFTPSRRIVDGSCYASYDDRFVVQLASKNGGVIVSNDNFKDLINEKEEFKEAIEKRLLMFCFVGDLLMVPDDPLGRNGPTLDEYLAFPAEEESKCEKILESSC